MELNDKTEIKSSLRKSYSSVIYAINQLDEKTYLTPRSEGKWSPGDILGHLILTNKAITKGMTMPKELLAKQFGVSTRPEQSIEELKKLYSSALAHGVKATPQVTFRGVEEKGKETMIELFNRELEHMIAQVDQWSEKELSRHFLPHPAFGLLTIREMLYFTELHNYHHLEQIKEVLPQLVA